MKQNANVFIFIFLLKKLRNVKILKLFFYSTTLSLLIFIYTRTQYTHTYE